MKIAIILFNLGGPDSLEAVQPFLRNLFGSTRNTKNRTELIVLITPRVIASVDEGRQVTEDYARQFESLTPLRVKSQATLPPPAAQTFPAPEPAQPSRPQEDLPHDH